MFAGAGGMMLGLEDAGFQTILANEIHADPCMTLQHNFPGVPIIEGPIQQFETSELFATAGFSSIPEVDLVAGGPPCQGFSTAGAKDPRDPRNSLIGDFVRVINDVRPRYFLLENVTGLLSMQGGKLWENVANELSNLGYSFNYSVLHAADYGVPQMRRRLIVLGARDGAPPPHPEPQYVAARIDLTLFSDDLPPYITCGEALADVPHIGPGQSAQRYEMEPSTEFQRRMRKDSLELFNHEASKHRPATVEYLSKFPPGGTTYDLRPEDRTGKQGVQRWPVDGIARTITTLPEDFIHPTQNRIPTIRELARIQSFPDRFRFLGQRTSGNKMRKLGYCAQSQQVGNAVPPLLAQAVGESIIEHL
ncbi:MAG: DNA cytosine methyltransferase [Pseudonocardia sp.]